ncbi:TraB/GumN family protein [Gemmobacter nectariphilus]|uniref:TraB/GumN family protein n=1 Tax=Gemmobacter nectariphilus TaxID=220343 RepID=UPI0004055EFC|nr:TraB/GumN family protein [Gemmobacter nectariphilus]
MRLFKLLSALVSWVFFASPGLALCHGADLIAALPADTRARLEAAVDARPYARGNLWRATRGAETIFLVGTYHLPDPRHEAMLAKVRPLLSSAAALLVEAGPEEEARLKSEVAQRPDFMMRTQGPTLPEMLDEADWQSVAAEMRARGVPTVITSRLRPWYVAMMLGIPACAVDGVRRGEVGLDHRLIAEAQARGLPIRALEPFDTLFRMFGDLPPEGELDMVRAALVMADRPEDMTVTLANAYFAGRSQLLWDFTLERALAEPGADRADLTRQFDLMVDVLVTRRNRSWLPVLEDAARHGPILAAFGALHLPGDTGVLALLAGRGFAITPIP